MSDNEFRIFQEIIADLSISYPDRDIQMHWDYDRWMVSVDGKDVFTIKGFNFLYCLQSLINSIKDELI